MVQLQQTVEMYPSLYPEGAQSHVNFLRPTGALLWSADDSPRAMCY